MDPRYAKPYRQPIDPIPIEEMCSAEGLRRQFAERGTDVWEVVAWLAQRVRALEAREKARSVCF